MLRTVEGILDEDGKVRLLEDVQLTQGLRVLVTLLDEGALAEDWDRPEEDEAWAHLQPERAAQSSKLHSNTVRDEQP